MMRSFLIAGALTTFAVAGPVSPAHLFCDVVDTVITAAKQQSAATAYCSSVLSIPTATSISTKIVTSTTVSVATVYTSTLTTTTTAVLSCATPAAAVQPTKRNAEPSPVIQANMIESDGMEKRAKAPVQKPSCLALYGTNQLITSACKCLNIAPSTTTVTSTSTSISTSSTTTYLVATAISTATSNFKIRISGSKYDGRYMQVGDGFGSGGQLSALDYTSGSLFSLDPNGALIARSSLKNYVSNYPPGTYYATTQQGSNFVAFVASKYTPETEDKRLNCKITNNAVDGTCALTCIVASTPPATVNNACPRINYDPPWYLGASVETTCGDSTFSTSPTGLPFTMFAVTGGSSG